MPWNGNCCRIIALVINSVKVALASLQLLPNHRKFKGTEQGSGWRATREKPN